MFKRKLINDFYGIPTVWWNLKRCRVGIHYNNKNKIWVARLIWKKIPKGAEHSEFTVTGENRREMFEYLRLNYKLISDPNFRQVFERFNRAEIMKMKSQKKTENLGIMYGMSATKLAKFIEKSPISVDFRKVEKSLFLQDLHKKHQF